MHGQFVDDDSLRRDFKVCTRCRTLYTEVSGGESITEAIGIQ